MKFSEFSGDSVHRRYPGDGCIQYIILPFFASATRKEHIRYNITAVLWMTEGRKRSKMRKVRTRCMGIAEGQSEEEDQKVPIGVLTSENSR